VLLTEEKLLLPVHSLAAAPDMDPDDSKQLTLHARTHACAKNTRASEINKLQRQTPSTSHHYYTHSCLLQRGGGKEEVCVLQLSERQTADSRREGGWLVSYLSYHFSMLPFTPHHIPISTFLCTPTSLKKYNNSRFSKNQII
jgi:hypothetical protein